jgi:deoxyribodipyrimidine photo-lyase
MTSIFWFRRDLRLADHPALNLALESAGETYLIATADQLGSPFENLSIVRKNSLRSSWRHLKDSLQGKLTIASSPAEMVKLAVALEVERVYVSAAFDTLSMKEIASVGKDLTPDGIELIIGPGNYAVAPGTVRKEDGTPYKVYTPFYKAWLGHSSERPVAQVSLATVSEVPAELVSFDPQLALGAQTMAGEEQALVTLSQFLRGRVNQYHELRDRADLGGTSHLSHALSHGEIHPRTIISQTPSGKGGEVFIKELAWREFYADVMHNFPSTLTDYLDPKFTKMRYDAVDGKFEAWKLGQTGYPMVDAGMRQLLATGWMHNRVRMIVASFLVKDLHIEWQHGARWFEENLTDYDPASNSHGWQWTAGCGTDASPYFRVFNPVTQGLKFDPEGNYVRKFIPELAHLKGSSAHEPWENEHGYSLGYAKRIVDHATEREEALRRLAELKQA